jgi:hypothetical protein
MKTVQRDINLTGLLVFIKKNNSNPNTLEADKIRSCVHGQIELHIKPLCPKKKKKHLKD